MGWFADRHHKEDATPGAIVTGVAILIQILINERARRYRYVQSSEELYEIKSKETLSKYIVNFGVQTCSCREWQYKVSEC